MEFIQYTINWTKGEILEAGITAACGGLIVICSLLFWKFGETPFAKALIVPLLVVGCIPLITGISGIMMNKKRIVALEKEWKLDEHRFLMEEKERVEGFDEIFKYTYPGAFICVVGGAILFFLLGSPTWKAVSLSLMVIGLMAYFIDHFAAERADIYLEHIKSALKQFEI
ncbi:hypothetical protein [Aureibacter tunicatorum]|uniref:Membrane protein n=1 Tax=Aureibacter tunicatorum TaxID=866807 RepID=A0AAE3XRB6_9BACT|nr:hypothetical protein [Aureibacter tunicatorum]MDR6240495.1 putative membrane protein [Aureibacter tunicatorum]BDD06642.1 hypothetical protein AUTU_41250 [Aureibacter tunicatorum]